ncbi:MAG: S-layer protein, partial [archaeon]
MQKKFVLKTIKKIAALSTGVAMLGATLTGAMALDLKDYPSPFVADGVYDDANAFVVGKDAMAADTLAALDIAANLQYMSKTAVTGT